MTETTTKKRSTRKPQPPEYVEAVQEEEIQDQPTIEDLATERILAHANAPQQLNKVQRLLTTVKKIRVKYVLMGIGGVTAITAVGFILINQNAKPKYDQNAAKVFDEKTEFLTNNPFTCAEPQKLSKVPGEYKQKLFQCIQAQATNAFRAMDKQEANMIRYFAAESKRKSQEEANSGQILTTASAQSLFNISSCPDDLGDPVLCIEGRKFVDSIDKIVQGEQEQNWEKIAIGKTGARIHLAAMSGNDNLGSSYTMQWVVKGLQSIVVGIIIGNNPKLGVQTITLPNSTPSSDVLPNDVGSYPVPTTSEATSSNDDPNIP